MNDDWGLYQWSDNKLLFAVNNAQKLIQSASALTANSWHHVVVSYQSGTGVISLVVNNGTPVTTTGATDNADTAATFYLGGAHTSQPFEGLIDEAGFWKRALSGSDITLLYSSGNPPAFATFN